MGKVLLRLPNWLGDIVMAAPAVAAIHAAHPETQFIAQTKAPFLPIARRLPGVVDAIPATKERSPWAVRQSGAALRALELDGAVIFPRGMRAALPARSARVPVRVGYGGRGRTRLFTHAVEGWRAYRSAHRTAWFGLLARAFGCEVSLPRTFEVDADTLHASERLLLAQGRRSDRPLVILEPGASYGAAKCWPAERFGELARRLVLEHGFDVGIVGTEATKPIESRVAAVAGVPLVRTAGKTQDLDLLLGIMSHADLVVSNDTGPMHVAAGVGARVLALFGASDPRVSSPTGSGERRVLYDPEPCSPCFLRTCPIQGHPCLAKIGVARVEREVLALLRGA